MKTVTATVNYPAYVSLEVQDDISEEELREKILTQSDKVVSQGESRPIIHDCSEPYMID